MAGIALGADLLDSLVASAHEAPRMPAVTSRDSAALDPSIPHPPSFERAISAPVVASMRPGDGNPIGGVDLPERTVRQRMESMVTMGSKMSIDGMYRPKQLMAVARHGCMWEIPASERNEPPVFTSSLRAGVRDMERLKQTLCEQVRGCTAC